MLNTTYEFGRKIAENSKVQVRARLDLANGESRMLDGDDIMMGGMSFTSATSSSGSFDIGAAIIGQFKVKLNNIDGRFDEYDFTGSTIRPEVGVLLDNGTIEWVKKGVYWIDQPDSYSASIELTALDGLSLLDCPYADVATHYPATLRTIVSDICTHKGLMLADAAFVNNDYAVPTRPEDDLTCRDMLSYAAQVAGRYAVCDADGAVRLAWYATKIFEVEPWLDGGIYDDAAPYESGDAADGGDFTNYGSGTAFDDGTFRRRGFAIVSGISSSTICTDDVVITGVRVTSQDEILADGSRGRDGETKMRGEEGYVIDISDNPLIPYGVADDVAARIYPHVGGMRFRSFSASVIGDPTWEVGDPCLLMTGNGATYETYLTQLTYSVGSYASIACDAETPSRHSASSSSAATSQIVKLRNEIKREKTDREIALRELAEKLNANDGIYMTVEKAPDGGSIYYMHDKPTLAESKVVWKMTADVIAVSTKGEGNYEYFLDASGTAILNRIYAIGLDADYIRTGALTVKKGDDLIFSADVDTGEVYMNASGVNAVDVEAMKRIYHVVYEGEWTRQSLGTIDDPYYRLILTVESQDGIAFDDSLFDYLLIDFKESVKLSVPFGNGAEVPDDCISLLFELKDKSQGWALFDATGNPVTWRKANSSWKSETQAYFKIYEGSSSADECEGIPALHSHFVTESEFKLTSDEILMSVKQSASQFAICKTAASEQIKRIELPDISELYDGLKVSIRFENGNSVIPDVHGLKLAVNGGEAYYLGTNVACEITGPYSCNIWPEASDKLKFFLWDKERVIDAVCRLHVDSQGRRYVRWDIIDGSSLAQISVTEAQIALKVSKGDVTSQLLIEDEAISLQTNRLSWVSTYTSMTPTGEFTCTSGHIGGFDIGATSISNGAMSLTSGGLYLKHDRTSLGWIGGGYYAQDESRKGLVFHLDATGSYMAWSSKTSSTDETYIYRLLYANRSMYNSNNELVYRSGRLYVDCPLDMHNNILYESWIDPNTGGASGGISGTLRCQWPRSFSSDGTANEWSQSVGYLTFKNGLLVGASL